MILDPWKFWPLDKILSKLLQILQAARYKGEKINRQVWARKDQNHRATVPDLRATVPQVVCAGRQGERCFVKYELQQLKISCTGSKSQLWLSFVGVFSNELNLRKNEICPWSAQAWDSMIYGLCSYKKVSQSNSQTQAIKVSARIKRAGRKSSQRQDQTKNCSEAQIGNKSRTGHMDGSDHPSFE
jgi:hypothetical protein